MRDVVCDAEADATLGSNVRSEASEELRNTTKYHEHTHGQVNNSAVALSVTALIHVSLLGSYKISEKSMIAVFSSFVSSSMASRGIKIL